MRAVLLPVAILSVLGVCGYGVRAMLTLPSAERPLLMRSAPFGQASVPQLLGPDVQVPTMFVLEPEGAFNPDAVIHDKEVRGTWRPVRAGFPPVAMLFGGDPGQIVTPTPTPAPMPQMPFPPWQWPSADQVQFFNTTPTPQQQASPR